MGKVMSKNPSDGEELGKLKVIRTLFGGKEIFKIYGYCLGGNKISIEFVRKDPKFWIFILGNALSFLIEKKTEKIWA